MSEDHDYDENGADMDVDYHQKKKKSKKDKKKKKVKVWTHSNGTTKGVAKMPQNVCDRSCVWTIIDDKMPHFKEKK